MKKIRPTQWSLLLLLLLLCCGCAQNHQPEQDSSAAAETTASRELFAMDTYMTIQATGTRSEEAVNAAVNEIHRLDQLLSTGNPSSEVSRINQKGSGILSEDTLSLVRTALWITDTTEGAYDITVYPLMELWGFTGETPALPDEASIQRILSLCGSQYMQLSDHTLTLAKGQGIDFGGIAKGYTGDRIMTIFREYGITSGVISLGGNVQCFGKKADGSLWRCGITDPEAPQDPGRLMGVVSTENKAVITSGPYERFFMEESTGKRYHHIMNIKTGYPAESGLTSVTIVSEDGTLADGLSTACFVMGKEQAIRFWRQHQEKFDMILADENHRLYITSGLEKCFSSDYPFEVIGGEQ